MNYPRCRNDSENRYDYTAVEHGHEAGMHCSLNAPFVLRAVILGNQNAGAGCDTHKQSDEHVYYYHTGAYRRQGVASHKVSHHDAVHRVVKLLKQVSDQKRRRKLEQLLPYDSFGYSVYPDFFRYSIRQFPDLLLQSKPYLNALSPSFMTNSFSFLT